MKNKLLICLAVLLVAVLSFALIREDSLFSSPDNNASSKAAAVSESDIDKPINAVAENDENIQKPIAKANGVLTSEAEIQKNKEIEFEKWQIRAGERIPDQYRNYSIAQLEIMSAKGDMLASTQIGYLRLKEHNSLSAETYFEKAVTQGSIDAATQASVMFDPERQDKSSSFKGDRLKAFIWAKIAADRGDADALNGVAMHGKYFTAEERLRLEKLASKKFDELSKQYENIKGIPFRKDPSPEWLTVEVDEAMVKQVSK
jgi:hypothetical protein